MMVRRRSLSFAAAVALAGGTGYGMHVLAEGAPTLQPLFYSGTLEDDSKLAEGEYKITLTFYDQEKAADEFCRSETLNAPVRAGQFRVDVSDCADELQEHPDAWVAVSFTNSEDGVQHDIADRVKIGAVPYAMEAQHAVTASTCQTATMATTSTHCASAEVATSVGSLREEDVQHALSGACPEGSSIREISAGGDVTCEEDDDAAYSGTDGVAVSGTTLSADTSYVQRRVSSACAAGSSIRAIATDGSVTCETAPKITGWTGFSPVLVMVNDASAVTGIATSSGLWRRIGDSIEVNEVVRFNADVTNNAYVSFELPSDLQLALLPNNEQATIGSGELWNGSATTSCAVETYPARRSGVLVTCHGASAVSRTQLGVSPKAYWVSIRYTVPIAGWTASAP